MRLLLKRPSGNISGRLKMDFWPEFLASSWGKEFVAGGLGGTAGIVTGYPLDTLRIRQQNSRTGSAFSILRHAVASEGPCALYRGMAAPLASVFFQVLVSISLSNINHFLNLLSLLTAISISSLLKNLLDRSNLRY